MSDSEILPGGLPPTPPNSYNPIFAAAFLPGQPVAASTAAPNTVVAAEANAAATAPCAGIVMSAQEADVRGFVRYAGLLTLTPAEWKAVTEEALSTGLVQGDVYFVSSTHAGKITHTAPSAGSTFITQVGIALSPTTLLVQIGPTVENVA